MTHTNKSNTLKSTQNAQLKPSPWVWDSCNELWYRERTL